MIFGYKLFLIKTIVTYFIFIDFGFPQILINDSSDNQYFEKFFANTGTHIFPRNLEIRINLTRMSGLLIYSIDKYLNQFIVTLPDTKDPSMEIKFRNEIYFIDLKDFCKCKFQSCLYETLHFRFQIENTIDIQCNKGNFHKHKFNNNKSLNIKYPIPIFHNKDIDISAHLWLINVPKYQNKDLIVYPHAEYLTGCILNISYNSEPVKFDVAPTGKCVDECKPGICSDGECLETFNFPPICNCNETFLNGNYCNESLSRVGIHDYRFKFQILKLFWNCDAHKILHLTNGMKTIKISLSNSTLELKYIQSNSTNTRRVSIRNCTVICKYLLFLQFTNNSIQLRIKNSKEKWINDYVDVKQDLSTEYFNSISFLSSCCSEADIAYKSSINEIEWHPFKMGKNLNQKQCKYGKVFSNISNITMKNPNNENKNNETEKEIKITNWNLFLNNPYEITIWIALIGLVICLVICLVMIIILIKYFKRAQKKYLSKRVNELKSVNVKPERSSFGRITSDIKLIPEQSYFGRISSDISGISEHPLLGSNSNDTYGISEHPLLGSNSNDTYVIPERSYFGTISSNINVKFGNPLFLWNACETSFV